MKKHSYKTVSILLALCMLLSFFPVYASAQSGDPQTEESTDQSLDDYLNQQLEGITLKLDENDFLMAFGMPLPIAPSKPIAGDVLSIYGGSVGAQGQYVINGGIYDTTTRYALTISRPMGGIVDYPASVDLQAIGPYFDAHGWLFDSPTGGAQISSLTFAPGETSKTVYLEYATSITTSYGTNGTEPFYIKLSNPYRAQPDYSLIEVDFMRNENVPYNSGYDISNLSASVTAGAMAPYGGTYNVGDLIPVGVVFSAWVDISSDMELTMRYSDSTTVTLAPVQSGTTGKVATYLYKVSEKDVMDGDLSTLDAMPESIVNVTVTDIGTYGLTVSAGGAYPLSSSLSGLPLAVRPEYGLINTDKTLYNGLEEVTVTVPLINAGTLALFPGIYPLGASLTDWFKLSLDGGYTFLSAGYISYAGGNITAKFPAPPNPAQDEVYFAEIFEITDESGVDVATAIPGAYISFTVTTAQASVVPVSSMTITGLPLNNIIMLDSQTSYQLGCTVLPATATYKGCTWSSSDPTVASITQSGLLTGLSGGRATITVTSDEYDYRIQLGETPAAALTKSISIIVGAVTPNLIAEARPVDNAYENGLYVGFSSNFGFLSNDDYNINCTIIDATGNIVKSENYNASTGAKVFPYDSAMPSDFSGYANGEYEPSYTVVLQAVEPLTGATVISNEAAVYILPPKPLISFGDYSQYQTGAAISAPVSISGLDAADFDVSYEIYMDGVMQGGAVIADQGSASPLGLIKNVSGSLASLTGTISITPAFGSGPSEQYEIRVYAKSGATWNTDQRSAYVTALKVDNGLVTIESADAKKGTADIVPAGGVISGPTVAQIAAATAADATIYDSSAAYELVLRATPWRYLYITYPTEWGRTSLSLGAVGKQNRWSINTAGFYVDFETGENTEAVFSWENYGEKVSVNLYQESLAGKVYVFHFAKDAATGDAMTFNYTSGNGDDSTRNTIPCDLGGGQFAVVIYEPDGIQGHVKISQLRSGQLYSAIVETPCSAIFTQPMQVWEDIVPFGRVAVQGVSRNTVTEMSYESHFSARFTGRNGTPVSGNIKVNYQLVNGNLEPIGPGYSTTVAPDAAALIAYSVQNFIYYPENRMLVEVIAPGYKPHLFALDYSSVWSYSVYGGATFPLTNMEEDAKIAYGSVILSYDDPSGKTRETQNMQGVMPNDAVIVPLNRSAALEVYILLEPAGAQTSLYELMSNIALDLTASGTGALGAVYPRLGDGVVVFGGTGQQPMLENDYAKLTFNMIGFPEGKTCKVELTWLDRKWNNLRSTPLLTVLCKDIDREQIGAALDGFAVETPGNTDIKEASEALGNIDGDVKNALIGFDIDLSSIEDLPFRFITDRVGNEFNIKGVLSYNFVPGLGDVGGGDMVKKLEKAADIEEYFNKVMGIIKDATGEKVPDLERNQGNKIEAFVGFRGYILGKAVYDQKANSFSINILEAGLIAEISGEYSSRLTCFICEFGFSVKGKLSSTLSITGPDLWQYSTSDDAVRANFVITNLLNVSLSANVGVGFNVYIVGAYVGVTGRGSATHRQRLIYRPYLPDWVNDKVQAGFQNSIGASLSIYSRVDFLWFTPVYEEWRIVDGTADFYSPDNSTNPLLQPALNASMMNRATVSMTGYSGALADGLRGSASARLYDHGGKVAYRDVMDPDDYGDDRIMTSGVSNLSAVALSGETAYGYDMSSSGGYAVAAWETMANPPSQAQVLGLDPLMAISAYYSGVEIMASLYSGGGWSAPVELSDNLLADMSPVTAVSGTRAAVVWSRGEFAIADTGQNMSMSINGDIVCRLYDGTTWSDPIRLIPISDTFKVTDYSAAVDDSGNLVVAASVLDVSTDTRTVYFIHVATDETVTVKDSGKPGATPQIIWDGVNFVAAYSFDGVVYIGTFDFIGNAASFAGSPSLPTDVGGGFRLMRDESGATPGIMWSSIELSGSGSARSVIWAAKLFGRGGGNGYGVASPVMVGEAPAGLVTASFDPYLSGAMVKAAVVYANEDGGGCVVIEDAVFSNSLELHDVSFDRSDIISGNDMPVSFMLHNNGYLPVMSISISLGNQPAINIVPDFPLAPNESMIITEPYTVIEPVGAVNYSFSGTNSGGSFNGPTGTINLTQTDTGITALSVDDSSAQTLLLVNLFNASQLSPPAGSSVKVGVYKDPVGIEQAGESVTITNWTAFAGSGYSVPIICDNVSETTVLYAVVKTFDANGREIYDTNIFNNSAAFSLNAHWSFTSGGYYPPAASSDGEGKTTELPGGFMLTTPEGQDPVIDENGSLMLPGGGTITTPGGVRIALPRGTIISATGVVSFPKGSGGGTVTLINTLTLNIREEAIITLDAGAPLGFTIRLSNPFADVRGSNWFYDYVMSAYAYGLMIGTAPDVFSPDAPTTRAMAVTVLYRLEGSGAEGTGNSEFGIRNSELTGDNSVPTSSLLTPNFSDVDDGAWYSGAVAWAYENGIVNGYGDGRFGPNDPITRQDLAVILARYAGYAGLKLPSLNTANSSFTDNTACADYAKDAVGQLYEAGIINGYPDGSFRPKGIATRAEFATMIMRFCSLSK